jgi:hypothetical protein
MMNLIKKLLLVFSLLFIFVIILKSPIPESTNIGTGDFRPYWSASYLLAHGQDFSNPGLMDNIERTLTGWDKPFTMMAWFAPTGMVVLLPFTFLPFEKAAFLWLLTNILVLSATAFLLWKDVKIKIWIPLLAVFTFPMTLLSLYVGQINTLVLFGLAVFISLKKSEYQYLRGIGLALTTIKPHLVILTLPLIILDCIYKKQWKILIGFFGSLLVCSIILFAFYTSWPISFWHLVSSGMNTIRETPTLSGLLAFVTGQTWGKWLWIPGLVVLFTTWRIEKDKWNTEKNIYLSLPLSLLISPIGWGYDQIILLIPILYLLEQVVNKKTTKKLSTIIIVSLFFIYGISFIMRIYTPNDVWFFWAPLWVWIVILMFYNKSKH